MTENLGFALDLAVLTDVSDGYRSAGRYDTRRALDRAGSINVEPMTNGAGFKIELLDRVFRDARKALRPATPGEINLRADGLFAVVQKCRETWVDALKEAEIKVLTTDRTEKARSAYDEAWDEPVDEATFQRISAKLALAGERLFANVFERNPGSPLDEIARQLREAARLGDYAFTVNTAGFHLPWSMLYTHPSPKAKLAKDGSNFDKSGFWGYRHIFEEYTPTYDIFRRDRRGTNDHLLARNGKLGFGAALHAKIDIEFDVPCIARHREFVAASRDRLRYNEWTKKAKIERGLKARRFRHQVVYFLCHGEGAGTLRRPSNTLPILEVTDGTIDAEEIRYWIANRFGGNAPLVFINACRGGQLDTLVYQDFSLGSAFLEHGAACAVGPQIQVPAVFAGEFGKRFFERLLAPESPGVGQILRDLTRDMWKRRNPFGLVYTLYAGADCHIQWG